MKSQQQCKALQPRILSYGFHTHPSQPTTLDRVIDYCTFPQVVKDRCATCEDGTFLKSYRTLRLTLHYPAADIATGSIPRSTSSGAPLRSTEHTSRNPCLTWIWDDDT